MILVYCTEEDYYLQLTTKGIDANGAYRQQISANAWSMRRLPNVSYWPIADVCFRTETDITCLNVHEHVTCLIS